MKKLLTILTTFVFLLSLTGCGNSGEYEAAKSALDSGDYNTAIALFTELAATGNEDCIQLLQEAKYLYASDNLDRENQRTVAYLEELSQNNYKDSKKIFEELYMWKAEIAISTSKQSAYHKDTLDVTSRTFPFYYFNFRIHGGPPDGEFRGTYEIVFSNGEKITDTYIGSDNDFYFAITLSATENPTGKTTFNVYGENEELLATATSDIR